MTTATLLLINRLSEVNASLMKDLNDEMHSHSFNNDIRLLLLLDLLDFDLTTNSAVDSSGDTTFNETFDF